MAVMVTVEFKLKPEAVDTMVAGMQQALPETRAFKGCQEVKTYLDEANHIMLLVEFWDRSEDQQAYLAWRQETGSLAGLVDLLVAPPEFRTYAIRDDV